MLYKKKQKTRESPPRDVQADSEGGLFSPSATLQTTQWEPSLEENNVDIVKGAGTELPLLCLFELLCRGSVPTQSVDPEKTLLQEE